MSGVPASGPGIDGECGNAFGVDGDLGWALGMVFRAYLKKTGAALADVPGGPRGYQVLAAAARGMPCSQVALAQHLGVDRTVMTYLLDDLVRAGLIERQPDPADRRTRRVAATGAGAARLAELDESLRVAEEEVLAALDDEDRAALRSLLRRVALHEERVDPAPMCQVVEEVGAAGKPAVHPQRARRHS